jgi:hypothetical protein
MRLWMSSRNLDAGWCGVVQVLTSREFKVAGAIGPCSSLKKAVRGISPCRIL